MLIPAVETPLADAGRSPDVAFEQTRKLQWKIWEVLSERFHFPETLRFRLCEELAADLLVAGAYCDD